MGVYTELGPKKIVGKPVAKPNRSPGVQSYVPEIAKGMAITGSPAVSIVMGMLTACFGGILRDLLAGEPSVLLRPEVYVTAAIVGGWVYTGCDLILLPAQISFPAGFLAALAIRGGALKFDWSFPPYKSRPGRRPEDIP